MACRYGRCTPERSSKYDQYTAYKGVIAQKRGSNQVNVCRRFHGTVRACKLLMRDSSTYATYPCSSSDCSLCGIIRVGACGSSWTMCWTDSCTHTPVSRSIMPERSTRGGRARGSSGSAIRAGLALECTLRRLRNVLQGRRNSLACWRCRLTRAPGKLLRERSEHIHEARDAPQLCRPGQGGHADAGQPKGD
jgi:hypothetical protein